MFDLKMRKTRRLWNESNKLEGKGKRNTAEILLNILILWMKYIYVSYQ